MTVWVVRACQDDAVEQQMLEQHCIFLPVDDVAVDFSGLDRRALYQEVTAALESSNDPSRASVVTRAAEKFIHEIQLDDWVVLPSRIDKTVLHIGKVAADYTFDLSRQLPHSRRVVWQVCHLPRAVMQPEILKALNALSDIFQVRQGNVQAYLEDLANNDWKPLPNQSRSSGDSTEPTAMLADDNTDPLSVDSLDPPNPVTPSSPGWDVLAEQAAIEQQPIRAQRLLYAIGLVTVLLITWSALAQIDTVTRGQGKVIPSRQIQVIGSQDGGVITEILVRQGDAVRKGDLLLKLDQTRSQATLGEKRAELRGLRVKAARLEAMLNEVPFTPTTSMLSNSPTVVQEERRLFESRLQEMEVQRDIARQQLVQRREELAELTAREAQLERELELAQEELTTTRPMIASGAVSEVEILRLEREVNKAEGELKQTRAQLQRVEASIVEAEGKIEGVRLEFENESREQLTETLTRINALAEMAEGLSDRVRQTNLVAPVTGTIKQLYYNTVGGVVLPGRDIVELVPADDTLLVEVKIRPQDIAFIAPGQAANVKVTAYDFVVYGGLDGRVEQIGADTVVDEEGNAFYEVTVRTETVDFGSDKPIIPGMTVEVDIVTGKKTVLSYIMKPVLRAHQRALSER